MKTIEEQAREYACDGIKPDSTECESCYNVYGKCNREAFLAGAKAAETNAVHETEFRAYQCFEDFIVEWGLTEKFEFADLQRDFIKRLNKE